MWGGTYCQHFYNQGSPWPLNAGAARGTLTASKHGQVEACHELQASSLTTTGRASAGGRTEVVVGRLQLDGPAVHRLPVNLTKQGHKDIGILQSRQGEHRVCDTAAAAGAWQQQQRTPCLPPSGHWS
jgi:hypothetical protein